MVKLAPLKGFCRDVTPTSQEKSQGEHSQCAVGLKEGHSAPEPGPASRQPLGGCEDTEILLIILVWLWKSLSLFLLDSG